MPALRGLVPHNDGQPPIPPLPHLQHTPPVRITEAEEESSQINNQLLAEQKITIASQNSQLPTSVVGAEIADSAKESYLTKNSETFTVTVPTIHAPKSLQTSTSSSCQVSHKISACSNHSSFTFKDSSISEESKSGQDETTEGLLLENSKLTENNLDFINQEIVNVRVGDNDLFPRVFEESEEYILDQETYNDNDERSNNTDDRNAYHSVGVAHDILEENLALKEQQKSLLQKYEELKVLEEEIDFILNHKGYFI